MTREQSLIFYIGTFLLSTILLSISLKHIKNKIARNIMIVISLLIPTIISGIRYGIGTDYFSYKDIFFVINNTDMTFFQLIQIYEPGHILICKIIGLFNASFQWVFLIYAIATIIFAYKAIQKQKENIPIFYTILFYLLIFFPLSYNGMRESLAVAMIFYGFTCLKEDSFNFKKAIIINLIAITIHYAALIVMPFIIFWNLLKNNKKREVIIISIYIIIVLIMYIFAIFIPEDIDIDSMFYKFTRYFLNIEEVNIGIGLIAIRMPIIIILILCAKRLKEENKDINMYIAIYIISIILMHLGYLNIYLNRFANYFSIIEAILIPTFIKIPKEFKYQLLAKVILIAYIVFQFIYLFYFRNSAEIFPYASIL